MKEDNPFPPKISRNQQNADVTSLSRRRLSRENLLPFILAGDFFDSEKSENRVASGSELSFSAQTKQSQQNISVTLVKVILP